eukprot:14971-Heterococcus_DN1.PRE.3
MLECDAVAPCAFHFLRSPVTPSNCHQLLQPRTCSKIRAKAKTEPRNPKRSSAVQRCPAAAGVSE